MGLIRQTFDRIKERLFYKKERQKPDRVIQMTAPKPSEGIKRITKGGWFKNWGKIRKNRIANAVAARNAKLSRGIDLPQAHTTLESFHRGTFSPLSLNHRRGNRRNVRGLFA